MAGAVEVVLATVLFNAVSSHAPQVLSTLTRYFTVVADDRAALRLVGSRPPVNGTFVPCR